MDGVIGYAVAAYRLHSSASWQTWASGYVPRTPIRESV